MYYQLARQHMPCDIILFSFIRFPNLRERDVIMYWYLLGKGIYDGYSDLQLFAVINTCLMRIFHLKRKRWPASQYIVPQSKFQMGGFW